MLALLVRGIDPSVASIPRLYSKNWSNLRQADTSHTFIAGDLVPGVIALSL
jgi:hypothetical protein